MATHPSTLAWKIPQTEEPGRLWSLGSLRVGHNCVALLSLFTFMHWRRKWQPTPVFLPGEFQGQGSLVGCHLWGCTKLDTTEVTQQQQNPVVTEGTISLLQPLPSGIHLRTHFLKSKFTLSFYRSNSFTPTTSSASPGEQNPFDLQLLLIQKHILFHIVPNYLSGPPLIN